MLQLFSEKLMLRNREKNPKALQEFIIRAAPCVGAGKVKP